MERVLAPGTAVIMTLEANLKTKHGVPAVAEAGSSGSIVFRTITDRVTWPARTRVHDQYRPRIRPRPARCAFLMQRLSKRKTLLSGASCAHDRVISTAATHMHAVSIVRILSTKSRSNADVGVGKVFGAVFGARFSALTRSAAGLRACFGA